MGEIRFTKAALPWSQRVGGGYPDKHEVSLAAGHLDFDVVVGKPHPQHGYFMTIDKINGPKPPSQPKEKNTHGS